MKLFYVLMRWFFRDGMPPKGQRWSLYTHHLGNYMHRWIWLTPFGTLRLHHILRSDDDRHLHDHPFDFTSFLLTGGYSEETFTGQAQPSRERRYWPRFSVVRKKAEDAHRLLLLKPVWTFVISGPKRRSWGFHTERGWVLHTDYLNLFPAEVEKRLGAKP